MQGGAKLLRVGILAPVHSVHPREGQEFATSLVGRQIFESPFAQPTAARDASPLLFERSLVGEPEREGRPVYSARLLPDLRFSDGTPVTSDDVIESLMSAALFTEQAEVREEDGRLLFLLKRPNARFDLTLAHPFCSVVLERGGSPLGTGPFMLSPGSAPERLRLERNPHYRREVDLEAIEFVVYPPEEDGSAASLVEAIQRGEVDFTNMIPREDVARLSGVRKWFEPGSSTALLYFNTEREPLDDARVRRALAMAIDRVGLASSYYANALAFAAKGLLPPMMGDWRDRIPFDRDRAQQLLEEAGVELPLRLRLLLAWGPRLYLPNPGRTGEQLAEMLGSVGVEIYVVPTSDVLEFRRHGARGDYDLALLGWVADSADPADFLEAILASGSVPEKPDDPVLCANVSRWRSREMDRLLERFRTERSEESRAAVQEILSEEVPVVPLIYGPTLFVHAFRLKDFEPSPLGVPSLAGVDLWS